ncbi:MAG: hypothetical protein LBL24_05200, partial [Bacteroidales bacterium]|nr:hypothetical protein [Bacteroidales bacterium]
MNRYIRYWPWFVMSVALCCALAFIWIKATPKTYQCTATMLIVEEDFSDLSSGFTERNQFKAKANVNNEIDMFMSPQLIQEVVKRLNLNISYAEKGWFRDIDLYTQSPVIAAFPDSYEQDDLSFQVELKPDSVVVLSNFAKRNGVFTQSIATKFNVPAQSPIGSIVISPSLYYTPGSSYQNPVVVSRISVKSASAGFAGALNVSLLSKEKTIISLSMDDASYQKAEDFLNALIIVYNENGLKNKNKNVEATLKQIDERLPIIEEELQLLDVLYATYKTTN